MDFKMDLEQALQQVERDVANGNADAHRSGKRPAWIDNDNDGAVYEPSASDKRPLPRRAINSPRD